MPLRRSRSAAARAAALLLAAAACTPVATGAGRPIPAPDTVPGVAPFAPTISRAELRADLDSLLAQPAFANAQWGVLVVDPARGDTLYARQAGKLFMPASNMKVITGAVALARLGADYRYRTSFATTGAVRDSALVGDLVVVGRGDPTVSAHMLGDPLGVLRAAADSLAARGVRHVTGTIRRGPDLLPGATLGYGWAWDDLDYPYSAGVDEIYFNEGFTWLVVRGGAAAGDPVTVETTPLPGYPDVLVTAATADSAEGPEAARDAAGRVVVSGAIAPGATDSLRITYADPAEAYLVALRRALAERGITVADWGRTPARVEAGAPLDTLFTLHSPPLREILPAMLKPSQNQIAELLFRTIALEGTGVGTPDSARAVVTRQLVEWGADSTLFAVRDGSGLSRHDYLAPRALAIVLDRMRAHPDSAVFYDALPVAGVSGTIAGRMKGTRAEDNVRAKTGYVDKARALSGYVTTADGRLLIFSLLANNWTTPVSEVNRAQDAIAARLAALRE